jgi:hypothetical protein
MVNGEPQRGGMLDLLGEEEDADAPFPGSERID